MTEVYTLLLSAPTQQIETDNGKQNTYPLIQVEPFPEDEQRTYQYHHGTRCVDGANQRQGQIFHAKVATNPRCKHNNTFQHDIPLYHPSSKRNIRRKGYWQEYQTTEKSIEEEYGYDGIPPKRMFLENIVETQKGSTKESEEKPEH